VLLLSALSLAFASAASASTLAGEDLESFTGTVACNPSADILTYHFEGTATGPHPGTFIEDGRVVLGGAAPPPFSLGGAYRVVVLVDVTFTIFALDGTINGEKHLLRTVESSAPVAICSGDLGGGFSGSVFAAGLGLIPGPTDPLCYSARFADGSSEQGRSGVIASSGTHQIFGESTSFSENFDPTPTVGSCRGGGGDDNDDDAGNDHDNDDHGGQALAGDDDDDD
jgi:hypothetical protein